MNFLLLFTSLLDYAAFSDIVLLVVLRVVPAICIFSLLTFIPVRKNIALFYERQTKKDTFVLSVRNFMLIGGSLALLLAVPALAEPISRLG